VVKKIKESFFKKRHKNLRETTHKYNMIIGEKIYVMPVKRSEVSIKLAIQPDRMEMKS